MSRYSQHRSLRERIERYFERNPSEELTKADMMVKFDCTLRHVEQVLHDMRESGLIERRIIFRAPQEEGKC